MAAAAALRCGVIRRMVMVMVMVVAGMAAVAETETRKTMVFHMHDVVVGRNATAVNVGVGSVTKPGFGAMVVIDDVLTETPTPGEAVVGRGQGIYVSDSTSVLRDPSLLLLFTAVFQAPHEYAGSTLSFQGADRIFEPRREVSIVGGTGALRFARGFAVIQTMSTSLLANAVLRFNVTLSLPPP